MSKVCQIFFSMLIFVYSLITFYGSFYREGSITLALEYMDGGSLANVISQVGPIPEDVLASMAFQVLPLVLASQFITS